MPAAKTVTDMTRGAIRPLILKFALPLIAGNLLQQLYTSFVASLSPHLRLSRIVPEKRTFF